MSASIKSKAAVDEVLDSQVFCCTKYCLRRWNSHFGPDMARQIVTTERAVFAGMDAVQRMLYHEERIQRSRDHLLKHYLVQDTKVKIGRLVVLRTSPRVER